MSRPIGPDLRIRDLNGYGVVWTGHPLNIDRRTHGIRSTYVDGCRCHPCRDAQAAYSRARYRAAVENRKVTHLRSTDRSPENAGLSTSRPQPRHGSVDL